MVIPRQWLVKGRRNLSWDLFFASPQGTLVSHPRAEFAWKMFLGGVYRRGEPCQAKGEAEEQEATELVDAPSTMVLWAEQEQKELVRALKLRMGPN